MTVDQRTRSAPSRRHGALVRVLLAVLVTVPADPSTTAQHPSGAIAQYRVGNSDADARAPFQTAPALLTGLARHAAATADDLQPGTDSCTAIRRISGSGGPQVSVDSVRVLHRDGSGLLLERPTTAHTWTRTTYPPGALLTGLDQPLAEDPLTLAGAVRAAAGPEASSTAQVAVLTDLATVRYLDLAHRRAVLRVLALLPSSTILAPGHDLQGRPTVGIRFDDGSAARIDLWITTATGAFAAIDITDPTGGPNTHTAILRSSRCTPAASSRT